MTRDELSNVVTAAREATAAVEEAKNKKASIKAVGAFQALDSHKRKGGLSVDGKWGLNTRTAAAWYQQDDTIIKPAFPPGKLTWKPPSLDDSEPATESQKAAVKKSKEKPTPSPKKTIKSVTKKSKRSPFHTVTTSPDEVHTVVLQQAPAFGQEIPGVPTNVGAEDNIVNYLNSSVNPKIDNITAMLMTSQLQKQATGEHKRIVSETDYKKQLLAGINEIKTKLNNAKAATLDRKIIAALLF